MRWAGHATRRVGKGAPLQLLALYTSTRAVPTRGHFHHRPRGQNRLKTEDDITSMAGDFAHPTGPVR
jgi:hypothetical protein